MANAAWSMLAMARPTRRTSPRASTPNTQRQPERQWDQHVGAQEVRHREAPFDVHTIHTFILLSEWPVVPGR